MHMPGLSFPYLKLLHHLHLLFPLGFFSLLSDILLFVPLRLPFTLPFL